MDWYYENSGRQVGPVSRAEILRLVLSQQIRPETMVWTASFGNEWRQASQAGLVSPLTGLVRPGEGIRNHWAWVALLGPSIINLLLVGVLLLRHVPLANWGTPVLVGSLLGFAVFMVSFVLDREILREATFNPPGFWWFLFLPGYLWVRMRRTGLGRSLFAVSMTFFVFSMGMRLLWHTHYSDRFRQALSFSHTATQESAPSDRVQL